MKIIFLDIDGVLNSTRTHLAFSNPNELKSFSSPLTMSTLPEYGEPVYEQIIFQLDPISIILLKKVVEDTGAKIVISSTWRIGSAIEHFHKMFDCYGWNTRDIIIDFTPQFGRIRGDEIRNWLNENNKITRYVIIDDQEDFYPDQKSQLIQTNPHIGFSHITYNQCIEKLGIN